MPRNTAAQAVSGTILGLVKDSSGAVVPGATIVLVNTGTGLTRTVVSNKEGEYTAPQLPTGNYNVSGEMSGFKKVTLANVHVGVDQKVRADVKLDLGDMTEAIEIQAETPLVNTSSSDLSVTVEGKVIETMPLNGRNFVSLTRTIPGVLRGIPGANVDGAGSIAWRASASFSANGQRARDNNYLLDGVDNNETWLQSVVIFPSVDAIDEFKLQTSTYSAEFGRSMGGVVNLQLKSGSNQYHGSAFDFMRNDALDANNWFNNRAGVAKPPFTQNQFGATIGGPILKDKMFFFADYQGARTTQGQTRLSTVPSDLMRHGDFSELTTRVIYDPLTGQPFPGNIIPENRWDPAAVAILDQYLPAPNTAGSRATNGQTINNYLITPDLERQDNQFDVKLDYAASASNHFFVRYSYQQTHRLLPANLPIGDAGAAFGNGIGDIKAWALAANDTHTFSASWINEFRVGYSKIDVTAAPFGYGTDAAEAVGIPGINLNPVTSAMSQIMFNQNGSRNIGSNGNQPLITNLGNLQLFDNVTHMVGRHTFKGGASVTFRSREILNSDTIVGRFDFNQNQTSNCANQPTPCTQIGTTGFDVASFLLGYATNKSRTLFDDATYMETRPEWALYIQDDFRVSTRLTLNLGLRWDVFVPWVEENNLQSNLDPSTGRFVVASDDAVINGVNVGRYLQTYSKADFGPRLGFAYDLKGNGQSVVRGGVGVFWNWGVGGTSSSKAQNQPFLQGQAYTTSLGISQTLSSGLPPPPGVHPENPPAGTTRSAFDVNYRDSYAVNFNLGVQQQLGRDYMFELAYAGSIGRQMILKTDQNQAPNLVGVTDQNVNRPFAKGSPALRSVGTVASTGELDYNALLAKFQKRFRNGFSALVAYTFAKTIDLNSDNDGGVTLTNIFDPGYNRGPADYDVTHTVSASVIYELPFARNSKIGGWQVTGLGYWRTGLPLTITQSSSMLSTGLTNNRPDRIGDGTASDQTVNKWFDPTAFKQTADLTGTFGTAGRNIVRGPGAFNIDMSLIKSTKFGKVDTELRVEAFNILNHPQFANPNTTFGSAAFGTITAMLSNPACSFCGTSERQVQLGLKLRF